MFHVHFVFNLYLFKFYIKMKFLFSIHSKNFIRYKIYINLFEVTIIVISLFFLEIIFINIDVFKYKDHIIHHTHIRTSILYLLSMTL